MKEKYFEEALRWSTILVALVAIIQIIRVTGNLEIVGATCAIAAVYTLYKAMQNLKTFCLICEEENKQE